MCVFEDLVQQYGPFFAWAYLHGCSSPQDKRALWVQGAIRKGLDDMNAFELGYTMSFASLQSVVWKVFCEKHGCSTQDRWAKVKEVVE